MWRGFISHKFCLYAASKDPTKPRSHRWSSGAHCRNRHQWCVSFKTFPFVEGPYHPVIFSPAGSLAVQELFAAPLLSEASFLIDERLNFSPAGSSLPCRCLITWMQSCGWQTQVKTKLLPPPLYLVFKVGVTWAAGEEGCSWLTFSFNAHKGLKKQRLRGLCLKLNCVNLLNSSFPVFLFNLPMRKLLQLENIKVISCSLAVRGVFLPSVQGGGTGTWKHKQIYQLCREWPTVWSYQNQSF